MNTKEQLILEYYNKHYGTSSTTEDKGIKAGDIVLCLDGPAVGEEFEVLSVNRRFVRVWWNNNVVGWSELDFKLVKSAPTTPSESTPAKPKGDVTVHGFIPMEDGSVASFKGDFHARGRSGESIEKELFGTLGVSVAVLVGRSQGVLLVAQDYDARPGTILKRATLNGFPGSCLNSQSGCCSKTRIFASTAYVFAASELGYVLAEVEKALGMEKAPERKPVPGTDYAVGDTVVCVKSSPGMFEVITEGRTYVVKAYRGDLVTIHSDLDREDEAFSWRFMKYGPTPEPTPASFLPPSMKPAPVKHTPESTKLSRLSPQATMLLNKLAEGAAISPRSALIDLKVGSLTRRIADIRSAGVDVKRGKRSSPLSGDAYSIYYLNKAEQRRVRALQGH